MRLSTFISRLITKYRDGAIIKEEDEVVKEYPLTIMVNDEEFSTIVCTPEYLEEMIVGYLASEGLIRSYANEIEQISIDKERGFAYVQLTRKISLPKEFHHKRFLGSCCGKSRQSYYFYSDAKLAKTSYSKLTITAKECIQLMDKMQQQSKLFQQTGGVHNAALCTSSSIIVTRTDIGRHNALDKIYGYSLMHNIPMADKVLVISGRISSEMLLKAAKIGCGILLSKSAPTDLALQLAEELNITTAGFVRGNNMNIYTHPERISNR